MTSEARRQYSLQALISVAKGRIDRSEYTEAAKVFREAADEADLFARQQQKAMQRDQAAMEEAGRRMLGEGDGLDP